jgi:hypothetical protein
MRQREENDRIRLNLTGRLEGGVLGSTKGAT